MPQPPPLPPPPPQEGVEGWGLREVQPDEALRVPAEGVIVHREAAACSAFWISSRIDILYLRLLRNVRHRPSRGGKKRERQSRRVVGGQGGGVLPRWPD